VDITGAIGFMVLIAGIMALGVVAGLKIFGSGTSNSLILTMGTAYSILWGIFSGFVVQMFFANGGLLLPMFYLVLTFIYCLGILGSFENSNGGND
jgi:hypothetical protein